MISEVLGLLPAAMVRGTELSRSISSCGRWQNPHRAPQLPRSRGAGREEMGQGRLGPTGGVRHSQCPSRAVVHGGDKVNC